MKQTLSLLVFFFSITQSNAQNKVINFDGVNDYVDLGSTVGTGIRTIEMWFKPGVAINAQTSSYSPLILRDETPNANEFGLTFSPNSASNSGELMFYIFAGSNTSYRIYSNSNRWYANQWYHVAAVIHPSQGMMLFIDGTKQISTNNYIFPPVQTNSSLTVGSFGAIANRYFEGSIDDIRLSDSALYTSNFTPSCPDLGALVSTIGVWNFNDSSNTSITIDSSNNMNNGIIYGATGVTENICTIPIPSNAMNFDGVDDYIDLGSTVGSGVRTIEMWFKPSVAINTQTSNYSPLILRDETPNTNEFGLTFLPNSTSNSGELMFYLFAGSNTSYRIYSNSNRWYANQWYHIAAVIHPSQGMMLFIDGTKQISTNNYIFAPVQSNFPVSIASWGGVANRFFSGTIDDLRFSNSALYTSNFTPSCLNLIALPSTIGVWNFNDSSNTSITIDSSGNMNNGIIYGALGVTDTICQILTGLHTTPKATNNVTVFPNPFINEIRFTFDDTTLVRRTIQLFTIDGKLVVEKSATSSLRLETHSFASGMYYYHVSENGRTIYSNKLVKE